MKKVHVLLADDHAIFREGLRMLLSLEKDIEVAGEADNGIDAVRLAKWLKPDVVVMDIGMSNLNGIEATRMILESAPDMRVLGLSAHKDRRFVMGMLGAGAKGYLLKDCAGEELVRHERSDLCQQPNLRRCGRRLRAASPKQWRTFAA
jgi:two-component system response regulator NreC